MNKKTLSKVMSELGKLSYKKSPRTREEYSAMGRKSGKVRRKKKLSTLLSFDYDPTVGIIETEQD